MTHAHLTRRGFLKWSLRSVGAAAALGTGGIVYVSQVEPYLVQVRAHEVTLPNLPASFDGYRIGHISDLHMGGWMTPAHMETVAATLDTLKPDLLAITGDFIDHMPRSIEDDLKQTLSMFSAPDGVYGVLGNHDYWTDAPFVRRVAESAGVQMLDNAHVTLSRAEESLVVGGVDDIWEHQQDLEAALDGVPQGAACVLLAHEPDYADTVALDGRVGLMLSGHTHGGQVRVPLRGALILPALGRKYDWGMFNVGGTQLHVSAGLGMVEPAVRFNCPPEITVLTLRRA